MSNSFDVLYNNITSNQAPGINEYEKSVFLTKAQDEIVKNYFTASSKGNNLQQGFDDSAKRQADFSMLLNSKALAAISSSELPSSWSAIDSRSRKYFYPDDVYIIINEAIVTQSSGSDRILQVIPLRYDEYTRLMSKPYKRPLKNQAWRLLTGAMTRGSVDGKIAEVMLPNSNLTVASNGYTIRYISRPLPIILTPLDDEGVSIGGGYVGGNSSGKAVKSSPVGPAECQLDEILHEDILQRAVELAKIAWTATGQDNIQAEMTAGTRSE